MPTVVPVRFAYATKDLWFDAAGHEVAEADHLICSTERGTEIGLATGDAREVSREQQRALCGDASLKPVLRVADDDDLARAEELATMGKEAYPVFRRLVSSSGLDMKPVGVEYLFGGERVVCYFSAEERVDFRQLVRQLASELQKRIDMRQIGVREEAAHVGGFAHCGQELCCARFGNQFEPVSIRMAKEQDLPLNSTKISGACGRLMCCLRYEFEAYRDFKSRAPKKNAVIETPLGLAKITEYDTPKEQIALRLENGKQIRVALADMVASEAAVRKSEELHCPCRPDTVTRAALDKLDSPEVQMALAELDREMGIVREDAYDSSDLFVESKSKSRRRRSRSRQGGQGQAQQGADQPNQGRAAGGERRQAADAGKSRRRRRKHATDAPESATQDERTQTTDQAGGTAVPSEASGPRRSRRRRRHHGAAGAEGASTQQAPQREDGEAAGGTQGTQEGQASKPRSRQRRRPGDRGGASAQPAAQQQGQQGRRPGDRGGAAAKPEGRRPGDHGGAQAGGGSGRPEGSADEGQTSRRRRRRRGGRGRGGSTGEAPAAE